MIDKEEIVKSRDHVLRHHIATLNPDGQFGDVVRWSKEELDARKVDYSDCLETDKQD